MGERWFDQRAQPVQHHRLHEALFQAIAYRSEADAMRAFQTRQLLQILAGRIARDALDALAPKRRRAAVAPGEDLVDQVEWPQEPGGAVVAGFEPQIIEKPMEVLSVVRLRRRGVVVTQVIVILDQRRP